MTWKSLLEKPFRHSGFATGGQKRNSPAGHHLSYRRQVITAHDRENPPKCHRPRPSRRDDGDVMLSFCSAVLAVISWRHRLTTSPAGRSGAAATRRASLRPRARAIGGHRSWPQSHRRPGSSGAAPARDLVIQLIDGLAKLAEFIGHRAQNRQVQNKSASGRRPDPVGTRVAKHSRRSSIADRTGAVPVNPSSGQMAPSTALGALGHRSGAYRARGARGELSGSHGARVVTRLVFRRRRDSFLPRPQHAADAGRPVVADPFDLRAELKKSSAAGGMNRRSAPSPD